jgi:hypothetical protein
MSIPNLKVFNARSPIAVQGRHTQVYHSWTSRISLLDPHAPSTRQPQLEKDVNAILQLGAKVLGVKLGDVTTVERGNYTTYDVKFETTERTGTQVEKFGQLIANIQNPQTQGSSYGEPTSQNIQYGVPP